jgi:hypothetical protein
MSKIFFMALPAYVCARARLISISYYFASMLLRIRSRVKKGYKMGKIIFPLIAAMAAVLCSGTARADASADLFVRVTWVQCGAQEELEYACAYDSRCCELQDMYGPEDIEPSAGDDITSSDIPAHQAEIEALREDGKVDIELKDQQAFVLQ